MFKLKTIVRSLVAAAVVACSLPASAQVYQIANSTSGNQLAAAPINAIVNTLNSNIAGAQNTANWGVSLAQGAQSTADTANWYGQTAYGTANYAAAQANNAWNYADAVNNARMAAENNLYGRSDVNYNLGLADCAMAMGGIAWYGYCSAMNPRPW
jgi:hypothetical protein